MDSKEDNIKQAKFVCQPSKKRESVMNTLKYYKLNRQKALLNSLSILLD